MEQKVCLDTNTVISILNNDKIASKLIDKIENSKIFITSVTLFELLQRETHLDKIETFRKKVEILDFDESSSREASQIFKNLKKKGKITDFRDIFIAATCIINNCYLLTLNKKHFENIDELGLLTF